MAEGEYILRPMNCELNVLSVPDGSAMFMQGDTTVIAGVYGPVEVKLQKMMYDKASVEATYTAAKGPQSINDRFMELHIKDSCEAALIATLHPGSAIHIIVQELQDCGGIFASAINAACLALINASLSMKFTIAAVHCIIDKDSGQLILDPDNAQTDNARAAFTYVFDSVKKGIVCCHSSGIFSEKELVQTKERCKDASQYVFDFYREIVTKYAKII